MRKIKFRVWDKEEKTMYYLLKNRWSFGVCEGNRAVSWEAVFALQHEDLIPMQYTGLKDKEGNEIYEGDIIEMQHCKKCNGLKAVVKRYWDGWWYFTEEETKGRMGEMVSQYVANFDEKFEKLSYCIIIGNKYENPELLGGE